MCQARVAQRALIAYVTAVAVRNYSVCYHTYLCINLGGLIDWQARRVEQVTQRLNTPLQPTRASTEARR